MSSGGLRYHGAGWNPSCSGSGDSPSTPSGGLRGLLVVEIVGWAVTCHGNDGTDTTCQCCLAVPWCRSWVANPTSCVPDRDPAPADRQDVVRQIWMHRRVGSRARLEGADLLDPDERTWAFGAPSCVGSATNLQLRPLVLLTS